MSFGFDLTRSVGRVRDGRDPSRSRSCSVEVNRTFASVLGGKMAASALVAESSVPAVRDGPEDAGCGVRPVPPVHAVTDALGEDVRWRAAAEAARRLARGAEVLDIDEPSP